MSVSPLTQQSLRASAVAGTASHATVSVRASVAAVVAVLVLLLTQVSVGQAASGSDDAAGPVHASAPADALAIMDREPYKAARWSYLVVDPTTGADLYAAGADQFIRTASIVKEFTVGTVYDQIGADTTITTPVYATAEPANGVLDGDLVLVGKGDLALGARNAAAGRFDFTPDAPDHVYADALPGSKLLEGNEPLAGLDDLAQQIAGAGISTISGDVVVDDRLWQVFVAQEGPVPPIFVNDNLLDVIVTPGEPGDAASVSLSPDTAAFTATSQVVTGEPGSIANVDVEASPTDPRSLIVSGTVPAGDPSLTVYRIPDAASWARTLFIEALERAGVTVQADALASNDPSRLPAPDSYPDDALVASITSAPLSEMGGMILATSYNSGANAFLCLLAVDVGSRDCEDGLGAIRTLTADAGIPASDLFIIDGQGGSPASATPRALITWLRYIQAQPWGLLLENGLPILGERGSLVMSGVDSPAAGRVKGKTGTSASAEPGTGRLFVGFQGLAGYLDVGTGTSLPFVVGVSDALFPDINGIFTVNDDVADVAAAFQQAEAH